VTKPKQTIPDLMIITGATLILVAIPLGIGQAFQSHHELHEEWRWAALWGALMMIATGITGGLLLSIGELIVRRRWKKKSETGETESAR
jgi:hypothetical protein